MEVKPLEVYSEASNYGVVRMPGRQFPGCVIQGDSLSILCRTARRVVEAVRGLGLRDEELLGNLDDLYLSLLDRLLHYQQVLHREGMELPYSPPLHAEDYTRLVPEAKPKGN